MVGHLMKMEFWICTRNNKNSNRGIKRESWNIEWLCP